VATAVPDNVQDVSACEKPRPVTPMLVPSGAVSGMSEMEGEEAVDLVV